MESQYIIDIDEKRKPYNTYMVLPLYVLQKITDLLQNEICLGLIDSDRDDRVIMHLTLDKAKIKSVKKIIASLENKPQLVYK